MSIKYAILGLLSWKPFTGYEMKKVFEESSTMYWSGNNNQIYKTLVQLLDEGLVTNSTEHQDGAPSKKIYTITDTGLAEIKEWVLSEPEAPEFRKAFLVQLSWSYQLSDNELKGLLLKYENEIKMQLLLNREKVRRGVDSPDRNPREVFVWKMISENIIQSYASELEWIKNFREELFKSEINEERRRMNFKLNETDSKKYIELISAENRLASEGDALELVSLCGEYEADLLMLHGDTLAEDFYKLKTGAAGKILQKLVNYRIKTAIILPDQSINQGRFREMTTESGKGNQYRIFNDRESAESWLLS